MKKLLFTLAVFASIVVQAKNNAGTEIQFSPIQHASFVITTGQYTIFVDPTGSVEKYASFVKPDIIVITHEHADHFDKDLINKLKSETTTVIAPSIITSALGYGHVMNNGDTFNNKSIKVEAIPMYNTTPERLKYHKKGVGNGYVITMNSKRIYISGDTEDIPEILRLKNIDYAFVCMNLPYTMSAEQAAKTVLAFHPKYVYPYHYRTKGIKLSDTLNTFNKLISVDQNIHVQLLKWYEDEE